jgi:hypothetical protein
VKFALQNTGSRPDHIHNPGNLLQQTYQCSTISKSQIKFCTSNISFDNFDFQNMGLKCKMHLHRTTFVGNVMCLEKTALAHNLNANLLATMMINSWLHTKCKNYFSHITMGIWRQFNNRDNYDDSLNCFHTRIFFFPL